ncbi:MAG TPA: TVP38/TMEM64 family protein [Geobacteraceae bacterium]
MCRLPAAARRGGGRTAASTHKKGVIPWVKAVILVVLLVVLGVLIWRELPSQWLDPEWIMASLERLGFLAPLAYMLLRTVAVVVTVVPNAPLDIVAGVLFTPFWGTVYSLLGSVAGAVVCFLLARFLGRDALARLLHRDITFADRFARRQMAVIVFLARFEPIFSFALVSYGAGLTKMSLMAFVLSTLLGITPGTILLNYYGKSLFTGFNPLLQIGLGLVLVVMLFVIPAWIRRKNPWGWYDKMTGRSGPNKEG